VTRLRPARVACPRPGERLSRNASGPVVVVACSRVAARRAQPRQRRGLPKQERRVPPGAGSRWGPPRCLLALPLPGPRVMIAGASQAVDAVRPSGVSHVLRARPGCLRSDCAGRFPVARSPRNGGLIGVGAERYFCSSAFLRDPCP